MTATPAEGARVPALAAGSVTRRLRRVALDGAVGAATHLPEGPLRAGAESLGELWYRVAPVRAAQARLNLARVCSWLVAHEMATPRVAAAASDPAALERLVRSAFRHNARYYLEVLRSSADAVRIVNERVDMDTPEILERALDGRPAIFVGLHFGAVEMPAAYVARRSGVAVTIPMETVSDRDIQAWFERTRGAAGIHIVGLREARREMLAALRRGEPVGLVGDRDLTGGGVPTELFGAPAPLPAGPGLIAIESGAPEVFIVGIRRVAHGRYRVALEELPVPTEGTRRERLTAYLAGEARAYERAIALAPDQWWAAFFPIWPDLVAAGGEDTSR